MPDDKQLLLHGLQLGVKLAPAATALATATAAPEEGNAPEAGFETICRILPEKTSPVPAPEHLSLPRGP
jgi:hypothetical protein